LEHQLFFFHLPNENLLFILQIGITKKFYVQAEFLKQFL